MPEFPVSDFYDYKTEPVDEWVEAAIEYEAKVERGKELRSILGIKGSGE